ncbi:TetR family transcriptional regulator [Pseudorhodoferax aquiterrae]|uniref:TetR family transcriptional regulator n=1 Tax=Pseudorhodoferax aquiterrae TaxID=747304 RepID=A0ABQ3FYD0_9BURK|nr:TetR family transcriptional regulator [Pseudorhodoferax aquiterrae]GHC73622.1 TetR family transcriptional regulator [Pseudorhodoferax aquiterrae]
MKVTKEQAQQNRLALLEAAGQLFKQHGIDGVGVADVCRQAGLTHGALYKHFTDKQDLAAQAFAHAFQQGYAQVTQSTRPGLAGAAPQRSFATYLDRYLSRKVRDDMAKGCPLVSTACETARQGEAVSRSYADAFMALRAGVAATLPEDTAPAEREALASTVVAALVGAMAISRGMAKADRAEADAVLAQVRGVLESLGGLAVR